MTLRRLAARGLFFTALDNWGYQLATLIVFSILARLVAPEAFGLVALATVFTSVLKVVADQGLADAIVQREELDDEHIDGAFWSSVALGAVLTACLAASAGPVARLFGDADLAPILVALSFTLVISGLSTVQRALLTRAFAFASLTLRSLLSVVVGGVAGVLAAVLGAGVWSLVVQVLVFDVVAVVTLWVASDWRPRLTFSWPHVRELLPFGANIVGFRALRLVNTQSDNLLIGYFLGATALGYYVIAYRLLRLTVNVSTAVIGSVAFPTFARVQHDRDRVLRLYYRTVRLAALVTFPAFLGLVVIAPEVTRLVFGPGWDDSIAVMRVLGFTGLATALNFLNPTVLKALGKASWRMWAMGLLAVLQITAIVVAVRWDILGVAVAVTAVTFAVTPVWFYAVHRLIAYDVRTLARQLLVPATASVLMVAAVVAAKSLTQQLPLAAGVPLLVVAGATTYGVSLWLLDRRVMSEMLHLVRLAVPGLGPRGASGAPPPAGGGPYRPRLVEVTGVAGAGKSTLTAALCDADPRYERAPFIHTRMPSHLVHVIRSLPRLAPLLAVNLVRGPRLSWADFKLMVYVTQWSRVLVPQLRPGGPDLVADQGPVYALVRLRARGRGVGQHRRFERWWDEMLVHWGGHLSAVVLLEAPADVLRTRIDERAQDHAVKGAPSHVTRRFVAQYGALFDDALGRVAAGGTTVLRFTTDDRPADLLAADLRAALGGHEIMGAVDG